MARCSSKVPRRERLRRPGRRTRRAGSLVAALSLVAASSVIPPGVLAAGAPAVVKRELAGTPAQMWVQMNPTYYPGKLARQHAAHPPDRLRRVRPRPGLVGLAYPFPALEVSRDVEIDALATVHLDDVDEVELRREEGARPLVRACRRQRLVPLRGTGDGRRGVTAPVGRRRDASRAPHVDDGSHRHRGDRHVDGGDDEHVIALAATASCKDERMPRAGSGLTTTRAAGHHDAAPHDREHRRAPSGLQRGNRAVHEADAPDTQLSFRLAHPGARAGGEHDTSHPSHPTSVGVGERITVTADAAASILQARRGCAYRRARVLICGGNDHARRVPHPSPRKRTPETFSDPAQVGAALAQAGYLPDEGISTAAFLALRMRRPLFVEGDPGVGKTALALALAQITGSRLIRLQCYEGIDASQALYDWDFPRQILHLRAARPAHADPAQLEASLYDRRFLIARPILHQALDHSPSLLLVDELDPRRRRVRGVAARGALADYAVTIPGTRL